MNVASERLLTCASRCHRGNTYLWSFLGESGVIQVDIKPLLHFFCLTKIFSINHIIRAETLSTILLCYSLLTIEPLHR